VIVAAGVLASSPALAQSATDPDPSRTGRTPQAGSRDATLATKEYVDVRVLRAGDTMTGDLLFSSTGAARRVGTSTAHSFDLVTDDTLRVRLTATGALEATVASASVAVAGSERLNLAADGLTRLRGGTQGEHVFELGSDGAGRIRSASLVVEDASGAPQLTVAADGAATFAGAVSVAEVTDSSPGANVTTKTYVDTKFAEVRKVPVAQGGLRGDGTFEEVFFENDIRVTTSHTIGVRYDNEGQPTVPYGGSRPRNALTAGPVTVEEDVVITVPADSVWTVV
jgi:hypothetical protein